MLTVRAVLGAQKLLSLADSRGDNNNVATGRQSSRVRETVVTEPLENELPRFVLGCDDGVNFITRHVFTILLVTRSSNLE